MPAFYRNRAAATFNPPYAVVDSSVSRPLLDYAVFDGGQQEWFDVVIMFFTTDADDCISWLDLVQDSVADWGEIDVSGFGVINGVQRGETSISEEVTRNTSSGLMNVAKISMGFAVEYTAVFG
jgi:hypothetical protein